jgi:hypothetical protein
MDRVIRPLVNRLLDKGMHIDAVPAYIRNALNIIAADPFITLEELKGQMRSLGWRELDLDGYTYQLILATFGPDYEQDTAVPLSLMLEYETGVGRDEENTWDSPDPSV